MMKRKKEIIPLFTRELIKENTLEESALLHELIKEDTTHGKKYDVVKRFWDSGYLTVSPDATNRIYNRVFSDVKDKTILWQRRQNLFLKVAASILVLLSTSLVYLLQKDSPLVNTIRYSTAIGETKEIILPDSSKVILNASSILLFPEMFSNDSRDVVLIGEGSFKVSKDINRPFRVETSHLQVEVLGTEFILSAYQEDEMITTYLKEGSVRLNGAFSNLKSCEMKPDEKAILYKGNMQMEVVKAADHNKSWVDGYLVFEQATLKEIVTRLERKFGVELIVLDEELYSYKYSGRFKNETLFEILGFLSVTKPFRFEIQNNTIVMSKQE
ncbi:DUF4974 domain-containing protein [Carboxylicivirga sediminis]|uniref:DUF4974 domain-containing protein n=1 Tax=Carboxylicivirga sediminis TaxID=2006564 RepID=A0A941F3S1_9BACT|nr:FecR domain-containing protein [Carboxylicivirga sediminis]MBR8535867.1 DUF4974 domain-containing protein [Carboxylicivirga sediminis]